MWGNIWGSVLFTQQPRNIGQKSCLLPVCLMPFAAEGSENVLSAQSGFYHCCPERGKPWLLMAVPSKQSNQQLFALIVEKVTADRVSRSGCICVGCWWRQKNLQLLPAPAWALPAGGACSNRCRRGRLRADGTSTGGPKAGGRKGLVGRDVSWLSAVRVALYSIPFFFLKLFFDRLKPAMMT